MRAVAQCRRCGYANAFEWPACMGCGRDARRVLRNEPPEEPSHRALRDIAAAGLLVPGASAALLAVAAWAPDQEQRSHVLLASAVVSTIALAGTGFVARDALRWGRSLPAAPAHAPAPPPPTHAPPPPPRSPWATGLPSHLTDNDLQSILDAW